MHYTPKNITHPSKWTHRHSKMLQTYIIVAKTLWGCSKEPHCPLRVQPLGDVKAMFKREKVSSGHTQSSWYNTLDSWSTSDRTPMSWSGAIFLRGTHTFGCRHENKGFKKMLRSTNWLLAASGRGGMPFRRKFRMPSTGSPQITQQEEWIRIFVVGRGKQFQRY